MSETFIDPAQVAVRCELTIDGVQATAARLVHRDIWAGTPGMREAVERELRRDVAEQIVTKLAPAVVEVRTGSLVPEGSISRAEALRLAQAHTKSLADLADRLEAAGENYAVMDARRAVEAGRLLVAKLEGDTGRLPVRPGE